MPFFHAPRLHIHIGFGVVSLDFPLHIQEVCAISFCQTSEETTCLPNYLHVKKYLFTCREIITYV